MKLAVSCLVATVLLSSAAFAANEAPRLVTANGHIASIDGNANSFVVRVVGEKGDGQDITFVVAADSKIVKGGAAIGLVDLKQGDEVNITYQAKDGRNMVVNVGVKTKD